MQPKYLEFIEGSKLDLSGGVLEVTYNDKSTKEIKLPNSSVKATGFDNTKVGKKKIVITYSKKSVSFNINVKNRDAKKIKIVTKPTKETYYDDEKIDLNGGIVEIEYTDKTKEKTELPSPNINIDEENEDTNVVVINYGDKSDSYRIKGYTNIYSEEIDDDDFSQYGSFYESVGMKPKDVGTSIIVIVVISVLMFMFVVKPKK